MAKYLVISYCDDQQEAYHDFVEAPSEDNARVIVGLVRDYAIPVSAYSVEQLSGYAKGLKTAKGVPSTTAELAMHLKAFGVDVAEEYMGAENV